MGRTAAAATLSAIATLLIAGSQAHAMPPDRGTAGALCASVTGTVVRIAQEPTGRLLTLNDARLARGRQAVVTPASTLEDRHGSPLGVSSVQVGDRLAVYAPGSYTSTRCAAIAVPQVVFAQDLSR